MVRNRDFLSDAADDDDDNDADDYNDDDDININIINKDNNG